MERASLRRRRHACQLGAAHRGDELVAVEGGRQVGGDDLAVAHHDDAVRGGEDLAEEMRDQDAARAHADDAADEVQKLPGGMRVERGGRLVEDDEVERVFGDGEGAGDLDHLAVPDRKIADDGVGRDAVARKNLVELAADQVAGAPAPAPALDRRMKHAGILRDRQVRAERQLLEDAADAELLRQRDRVAGLLLSRR